MLLLKWIRLRLNLKLLVHKCNNLKLLLIKLLMLLQKNHKRVQLLKSSKTWTNLRNPRSIRRKTI
jgi:hypothetical protein